MEEMKKIILPAAGLGVGLILGVAVTLLLAEEITGRLLLSLLFVGIPYLLMAASILLSAYEGKDKLVQNQMITTICTIYLMVAIVATVILGLFRVSTKVFVALELVVLGLGILGILAGLQGKSHIEKNKV